MRRLAFVLAFAGFLAVSVQATAETASCAAREDVLTMLSQKYAEAPVAVGRADNGGLIEVLSSLDGETWTIIITMPSGVTCMVAAGEDWEQLPLITAESQL